MKTNKILTSSIAAAALVGAIGLAYAQTAAPATDNTVQQPSQLNGDPAPVTNMNNNAPGSNQPLSATDNSATTGSPAPMSADTTGGFQGERMAQADRN